MQRFPGGIATAVVSELVFPAISVFILMGIGLSQHGNY
jgi:hypothetical protein